MVSFFTVECLAGADPEAAARAGWAIVVLQEFHRMPEAHAFGLDDPVDHRPAGLARPQAVPQVLLRRHHQRRRLVVMERAAADEIHPVFLEGDAPRLGQALHRDLRL
jgi:hypothetical protein